MFLYFFIYIVFLSHTIVCIPPMECNFPKQTQTEEKIENKDHEIENEKIASKDKECKISITNSITSDMLSYDHWTGTYEPTKFSIHINDKKIEEGETIELNRTDTTIEVRYDYSFMNGMRKGAKIVTYKIDQPSHEDDAKDLTDKIMDKPSNNLDLNLTFSWESKWHVLIDNATPIKSKKNKYSG